MLNARNDPFVPASCLPERHEVSSWVTLWQPDEGGHVGFPGGPVPGYVTADLMAEYTVNDRYTIKANLTNVTNKLYADAIYSGHYVPGAGRLFQVTASVKF